MQLIAKAQLSHDAYDINLCIGLTIDSKMQA